jgi:hypothetical protein
VYNLAAQSARPTPPHLPLVGYQALAGKTDEDPNKLPLSQSVWKRWQQLLAHSLWKRP